MQAIVFKTGYSKIMYKR